MADITGDDDPEFLNGTKFDDRIEGLGGDDEIAGDAGNDDLYGGADNDLLWGDVGRDFLYGGEGDDVLEASTGHDRMYGGDGMDTLEFSYLTFFGGTPPIYYTFRPQHVAVAPDGSRAFSVEMLNATGGTSNDIIHGWHNSDFIGGWDGNDQLYGEAGDDLIGGSNGDDTLYGGKGDDRLYGDGDDDVLYGGNGNDTLVGATNFDLYPGFDVLEGGRGADAFYAASLGADLIYSHSGAGVFVDLSTGVAHGGEAEGDTFHGAFSGIFGSAFADTLIAAAAEHGGGGGDRLVAGTSTRIMEGGDGSDVFEFAYTSQFLFNVVHIVDFDQAAHELLSVHGIDSRQHKEGDQDFTFIGTDAFSHSGQLRYEIADGHTTVEMNIDGHLGTVEYSFVLDGEFTLTAGDFAL